MTEGTVKIWQHDPGYRLFHLAEPIELPSRAQGVFVLLADKTVVLIDVVEQIYSPAKAIERGTTRPEVKPFAPTHAAMLQMRTWHDALAECRRLRGFYGPAVKLRVRD